MAKEVVPGNPGAPFAKAVKISGMMFTSGNCAAGDGIQAQTRQVLSNLEEISLIFLIFSPKFNILLWHIRPILLPFSVNL